MSIILFTELKKWARCLNAEVLSLYLAVRDPRTPWYAKVLVSGIVAYALSPIDLIPDFVPVFGYLDDLLLIPAAIALAIKLIPDAVLVECRVQAQESLFNRKPVSRMAGVMIVLIMISLTMLCGGWFYQAVMA